MSDDAQIGASWSGATCVILPTLNESASMVIGLVRELATVAPGIRVIVVDDSPLPHALPFDAALAPLPATSVILRCGDPENRGGLGGAVLTGMRRAAAEGARYALVMDADGQHPPELVPTMLSTLVDGGNDIVVASRYRPGGSAGDGLGITRKLISRIFTAAGRLLFPRALRGCTDPMSGFFAVRLDAINLDCWADGFKILLQLLGQHPHLRRGEVAFRFLERREGASKAGIAEGVRYLRGLVTLRLRTLARPTRSRANKQPHPDPQTPAASAPAATKSELTV